MKLSYLYAKFIRKYVLGKAIINSKIHKTASVSSGSSLVNTIINKYSYSGYDCFFSNCIIGKYCSIADNVYIGGAEHPLYWVSTSPVFQNVKNSGPTKRFVKYDLDKIKTTIIGNDVWIGQGAFIKQGVKIGDGAVIAARAVVIKDVEPYSIVGGCPAKLIKFRFDEEIIKRLLLSAWWDLSEDNLEKVAKFIKEPEIFLTKIEKMKKEL